MIHKFLPSILFIFLLGQLNAQSPNKIPFIQNKGQWQNDALFKANIPEGQAIATPTGMLIGKFDQQSLIAVSEWGMKIEDRETGVEYTKAHPTAPALKGHGWRFHFLNGNPAMTIESKNESKDFYNFWIGDESQHASHVHSYDEIIYKNVYSGVDVRYYTADNGDLENDIIVKPHSDITNLSFEIEGVSNLRLNVSGELIFSTTVGDFVVPAPVSYLQDGMGNKTPILVRYRLSNGVITFEIPKYDENQTLVIDPIVVRWATWATNNSTGGDSHNHSFGIDNAGALYTTGRIGATSSSALITVGAFQSTSGGALDIFIGKYTEPSSPGGSGARVWQTYLGGAQSDNAYVAQIGTDGFLYVCGNTYSNMNKTYGSGFTAGAWTQRTGQPNITLQALVIKLDLAGNGAMVRELGTTGANDFVITPYDMKFLVTSSTSFDLIVTGSCQHPAGVGANGDFPTPKTPSGTTFTQPAAAAAYNGFVFRISKDFNTLNWINEFGSDVATAANEQFNITTLDFAGNIYLGGSTEASSNISYNNPSSQTTRVGNRDGWFMKLTSAGTVVWSRYYNSTATDSTSILSMELTRLGGGLLIGGITSGLSSANITAGAYDQTYGGGAHDLFVAQMPLSGASTTWGSYIGGTGDEINLMGLNRDLNDDIYILGYTNSTNYPTLSNPVQSGNMGGYDAIFTKMNSTGSTLSYSTYLGGTSDENDPIGQRGIQFSNCRTYLAATMSSTNIPLTAGAVTTTKSSAAGVMEAVIYSLGNPPDLVNNTISPLAQTINCGQSATPFTGSVPTYSIPTINRAGTNQTPGTSGAYPSGVPTVTGYQWQISQDHTFSYQNIPGATGQNYTPSNSDVLFARTYYRRTITADACSRPADPIAEVTVAGAPSIHPTATCVSTTINFFANPQNQSGAATYNWTGPNGFSSTLQNPVITGATTENSGYYFAQVIEPNGCRDLQPFFFDFVTCNTTIVTPVTLINFTAVKNKTVSKLDWSTSSETNSKVYMIERSEDGRNNFLTLGSVDAAGYSLAKRSYTFTDKKPITGGNYYRLKIIDIDGKYKYSQIRYVDFSEHGDIVSIFPNPANTTINIEGLTAGNSVKVINILGEVMADFAEVSGTQLKIDISNYSKGVYFISTGDGQTIKFVKQ